jgi:long-chain acyl-CoA synthetase
VTDDAAGHAGRTGELGRPTGTDGNLADLVSAAAQARPEHAAFLHAGRCMTWSEVDAAVDRAAAGLLALGLTTGDRVGLHLGNTLDFPVAYFGVLRAGLVAVPLNPGYTEAELRHALGDSGARALLSARSTGPTALSVFESLDSLEHVIVTGTDATPSPVLTWEDVLDLGTTTPRQQSTPTGGEDLALVIYTSGTSGTPRGAMLPHRALLANLEQGARIAPPVVTADDVVLLVLPLFHIYGLNAGLGAVAHHGATGVLCERFDPVDTLEVLRREKVTSVLGAPPDVRRVVDAAGRRGRLLRRAGRPERGRAAARARAAPAAGPHRPARLRGLRPDRDRAGPDLDADEPGRQAVLDRPGHPGVELRLVDEGGRPVEEGDPGEIVVRGDNVFTGYWPDGADGPVDGWFPTGDVAYLDADGDLFLVDRRKELVLVSGFNVYPREVEDVLAAHPDVREAAVLGVPHPYTGETVTALVVLEPGAAPVRGRPGRALLPVAGPLQVPHDGRVRGRAAAQRDREGQQGPAARALGVRLLGRRSERRAARAASSS